MTAPRNHILHVDMDAFYAAIEQRDHPEYLGKPVIVGARPDQRGVVSTCSYEARQFGVHSAMPSRTAGKLCPQGVFVPPRMERYVQVSEQLMTLLEEFTPLVEPLSLDEAFLDVAGALRRWGDAVAIAEEMRSRIRARLQLTGSVGVASNKFLAKVASDLHKPDGLTVVPESEPGILAFLAPLPVNRLWGVGKVTGKRLAEAGIQTIGQIQALTPVALRALVGKGLADAVWELAQGHDDRAVEPAWDEKSISNETTFATDCAAVEIVWQTLLELTENVGARLRRHGKTARTAQIKVRFGDFSTITRQTTFNAPVDTDRDLLMAARLLFERERVRRPVRLIGFGVSHLAPVAPAHREEQPSLFPELRAPAERAADHRLDKAVDRVRGKFGDRAIVRGDWRAVESEEAQPPPPGRPETPRRYRRID